MKTNKETTVDKIITKLINELHNINSGICDQITGRPDKDWVLNRENAIGEAITQICQLIPEGGVVIAEGKLWLNNMVGFYVAETFLGISKTSKRLNKLIGKKGKLIFIEEK